MDHEPDIATVAGLLANPARVAMLEVLLDGGSHAAGDLARQARVAPSTASGHLAALVQGRLVDVQRIGRQRRHQLAGPAVAQAMESLALLAAPRQVSSQRQATKNEQLQRGRTCYDHVAGQLGVALADALRDRGAIRQIGETFDLTRRGETFFEVLGVDVMAARKLRRGFTLACRDWTEGRFHLGGALGAALCARLLELSWIRRRPSSRAVLVTEEGLTGLRTQFGIDWTEANVAPRRFR